MSRLRPAIPTVEPMSDFVQQTQQEFWRPPAMPAAGDLATRETMPTVAEACPHCGTEFLLGSRFCHCCGSRRPNATTAAARNDAAAFARLWEKAVAWTRSAIAGIPWGGIWNTINPRTWVPYLHLHEIRGWIGLSTASLIAFTTGLGCVAGALLVGLLAAKTLVDWQAIQIYRVEWLLGAIACFVAGILLRKPSGN